MRLRYINLILILILTQTKSTCGVVVNVLAVIKTKLLYTGSGYYLDG